jgi:hypothetical protein
MSQIIEHKTEILQSFYKKEVISRKNSFFRLKNQKEENMTLSRSKVQKTKSYKKNTKQSTQVYQKKDKTNQTLFLKLSKIGTNQCMFLILLPNVPLF